MALRTSRVCQGVFIANLFLAISCQALAGNEYVNPTFCYRIVQPNNVWQAEAKQDGSGLTMEIGGECERHGCVRISTAAAYLRDADGMLHLYSHDLKHGWVLKSTTRKHVSGIVWTEYLLNQGRAWIDIHETSGRRDQARYQLTAQFVTMQREAAQRSVAEILGSWRWLSACL